MRMSIIIYCICPHKNYEEHNYMSPPPSSASPLRTFALSETSPGELQNAPAEHSSEAVLERSEAALSDDLL